MCADFIKFLSSERNMTISHRSVHLCLVQKSVMIFHTGAVELSQVFDFRKLSTVLESAAKVQENKYSSQRSIKNIRFSIRRFDFRVLSLSLWKIISYSVVLSCFPIKKTSKLRQDFLEKHLLQMGFLQKLFIFIFL